jgi:hypothetical protein
MRNGSKLFLVRGYFEPKTVKKFRLEPKLEARALGSSLNLLSVLNPKLLTTIAHPSLQRDKHKIQVLAWSKTKILE